MTETFHSAGQPIQLECYEPTTGGPGRKPAIVLLHGSGGNTNFWLERMAPNLTAAGGGLFAPHYFNRTNTTRADLATITDGLHVPQWLDTITTAHSLIAARPSVDPNRIAFVGISLGAYLSLALAAMQSSAAVNHQPRIRCIVELSGGLVEPYALQATSAFPPTMIVHGGSDEIVPAQNAHELEARLRRLNVAHETLTLPGEGHWFSTPAQLRILMAVANFLRKHL